MLGRSLEVAQLAQRLTSPVVSLVALFFFAVSAFGNSLAAPESAVKSYDHRNEEVKKGQKLLLKGDCAGAEQTFKQALRTSGRQEKTTIDLLNFIGVSLHCQKKDVESALYFKKALALLPRSQINDLRRAKLLSNLSLACSAKGNHSDALKYSIESVRQFRRAKSSPLELSVALNSCGRLKLDEGEYRAAESFFAQSIVVRQSINGTSSPDLISPMINLSTALIQQDKFAEADAVCSRAIEICRKKDGDGEGDATSFSLFCQSAQIDAALLKYKQSLFSLSRAKEIADHAVGRNSEEALTVRLLLSDVYDKDGQLEQAEKSLVEAVEISKFAFGAQHDRTIEATLSLADLYDQHGKNSEADSLRLLCRVSRIR